MKNLLVYKNSYINYSRQDIPLLNMLTSSLRDLERPMLYFDEQVSFRSRELCAFLIDSEDFLKEKTL